LPASIKDLVVVAADIANPPIAIAVATPIL
jgi:hypothetical protein